MLNEQEIREMITELVSAEDIYGIQSSPDQGFIQARVIVEELPYLQTFRRDNDTGKYHLESKQPLGQQKL